MGTRIPKRFNLSYPLLGLLTLSLLASACSDDSSKEAGPSAPVITASDSGASRPIDAGSPLDASTGLDSGASGATDAGPGGVNTGSDCPVSNGCYPCAAPKAAVTPTAATSERLLNTCSTGCRPFDNKKLPGFTGTLPPLQ